MCLLSCTGTYLCVVFFFLSLAKISSTLDPDNLSYTQGESCKILLNNGQIIDLSSLLKSDEPLTASTDAHLYFYHPCKDVPLSAVSANECQKGYGLCYFVASNPGNSPLDYKKVLSNAVGGNFSLLALNDESTVRENRMKLPEIVFKHRNNLSVIITTSVQLECDEKIDDFILTIGRSSALDHMLRLVSKHNCLETQHYMSGGTVFFIILIVFATVYFIGGILVLKFIRGATGIEMIPNHAFWCNLPQLIKNGLTYLASCGKSTPDSYEKI